VNTVGPPELAAALVAGVRELRLRPGRYGPARITRPVRLVAADPARPPRFGGLGTALVVDVEGSVALTHLRFGPGIARRGAALRVLRGEVELQDCELRQNLALGDGGALHVGPGASVRLTRCVLWGNRGVGGGAVCADRASVQLVDCQLHGNRARCGGAVALDAARAELSGCLLVGNRAARNGAALALRRGGSLRLDRSALAWNRGAPAISREDPAPQVALERVLGWANDVDLDGIDGELLAGPAGLTWRGGAPGVAPDSPAAALLGWSVAPAELPRG